LIVVDTNTIAYLFIKGQYSEPAEKAYARDPLWAAPLLWRSEFRSVLVKCVREGHLLFDDAARIGREAGTLMAGNEYAAAMGSSEVLRTAVERSGCSAYDAEFVTLARELGVPLVTADVRLQKAFPGLAISPERFVK
jgi:predicted nucleic acid-binding protein